MANSIRGSARRLRLSQLLIKQASARLRTKRTAILGALIAGVMIYAPAQDAKLRSAESPQNCPQPGGKVDLAFIIDRSGSFDMNMVGQSYNVQIDGVLRVLRDPSLIPRDGSVAVTVETFAGSGTIQVPLKQIDTAADAEAIAALVESLRCTATDCTPTGLCPAFGSNPASNYAPAITTANDHLTLKRRPGARRVLLLSSDGQPSDLEFAVPTAQRVGGDAIDSGIQFELDLILLAQQAQSCSDNGSGINQLVFPQPACDLPGAVLVIERGACNKPCASLDDGAVKADCDRQVKEFAELTHRVLRSQPATRFLTVNTVADPAEAAKLSLRQAIEIANDSGGATTITFDSSLKNTTIRPRVPLPALNAPDIRICGCEDGNCDYLIDAETKCEPFLTIDGIDIDRTKGDSDGILILSDRGVVRGLRIINFAGAGVASICNPGSSRIERNRFENNKKAGVRIVDPSPDPDGPVRHNIGNTISMNDIIGSETPIDLGGDGPTPNDPGDLDVGPNTLLNFPDNVSVIALTGDVSAAASSVSFTGQVNGATAAGATVEIFAIESFRPAPGGRVIDGVTFRTQTKADAKGKFTVTGPDDSPTCGYTATVTDVEGNTSELMFPCTGFAFAKATTLDFGAAAAPNGDVQNGVFSIENTGCSPLFVSFASLIRNGFSRRLGDDLSHFDLGPMFVGQDAPGVVIPPGQMQKFPAKFDPAIPIVVTGEKKVHAAQVLAAKTMSTLELAHNGCAKSDHNVTVTGLVDGSVILIDPKSPRASPLVTLTRSGDELSVSFSIFDSDLNVNKVNYEFFKVRDNQCSDTSVPVEIVDQDLAKAIRDRRPALITGQSFTVIQPFSGAKKNPEAGCVRVTVSDGKTSASATSLPSIGSLARRSYESQDLRQSRGSTIVRTPLKLQSTPKQSRAAGRLRNGDEKEKR